MPVAAPAPSVSGMNSNHLLRIGGAAAILAVIVQLAAAMLEPIRDGDTDKAIRTIAESGAWTGRWLVHLAGIVLIVIAVAVVTRTFSEGRAKEWARVGQSLFVIAGTLGVAEVLVGGSTKHLADGWAVAAPGQKLSYRAAFEGAWNATVALDFGALILLSLYIATLAAAILTGDVYARWVGWTSAVAAPLLFVGMLLELRSPVGTAVGVVGNLLVFVVLIALGLSMWRRAASPAMHDADGHAPYDRDGLTRRAVSHVEQAMAPIEAAETAVDNP